MATKVFTTDLKVGTGYTRPGHRLLTVGGGAPVALDATALTPDMLAAINVDIVVMGPWDSVRDFVNRVEREDYERWIGRAT